MDTFERVKRAHSDLLKFLEHTCGVPADAAEVVEVRADENSSEVTVRVHLVARSNGKRTEVLARCHDGNVVKIRDI